MSSVQSDLVQLLVWTMDSYNDIAGVNPAVDALIYLGNLPIKHHLDEINPRIKI